jgi:hypothetical protein
VNRSILALGVVVCCAGCQLRGSDPDDLILERTYFQIGVPVHRGQDSLRDPIERVRARYDTLAERHWYTVSSAVSVFDKAFTRADSPIEHEVAVLDRGQRFYLELRFWVEGEPWFRIQRDLPAGPTGDEYIRVRDLDTVTVIHSEIRTPESGEPDPQPSSPAETLSVSRA